MIPTIDEINHMLTKLGLYIKSFINNADSKFLAIFIVIFLVYLIFKLFHKSYSKFSKNKINYSKIEEDSINDLLIDGDLLSKMKNQNHQFDTFKKQYIVTPKDFFLFPEGFKHLKDIDWNIVRKILFSLVISDESMRRYYGKEIICKPTDAQHEIEGILLKIESVEIIADTVTAITIALKNNKVVNQNLNMGINKQTIKKNATFSLLLNDETPIHFEELSTPELFKNGCLTPGEEVSATLFFKLIERAHIKNLRKVEVKVKLKYTKQGLPTVFILSSKIKKNDFPDVINESRSLLELDSARYLLSCGGTLLLLLPIALSIFFLLSLLGMFFAIVGLTLSVVIIIWGINLNAKLYQLFYDLNEKSKFENNEL